MAPLVVHQDSQQEEISRLKCATPRAYLAFEQHDVDEGVFVHGRQHAVDGIGSQREPEPFIAWGGLVNTMPEEGVVNGKLVVEYLYIRMMQPALFTPAKQAPRKGESTEVTYFTRCWLGYCCSPVILLHRTADVHDDHDVLRTTRSCHVP